MLPKAFLFDFDGVIVDSANVHNAAWRSAFYTLFKREIPPFPHATHSGKAPILIAEYFCEHQKEKHKTKELFKLKGEHLHANKIPPALLPGVHEIQNLLAKHNIPYGIASNATKQFVGNSIQQLNIKIEHYLGFEDYKHPKPHPEPYLSLAEHLGVSKIDYHCVWVFEDSLTGTIAAKEAGMIPIGIMSQYSEEELRNAGSQFVFPTLLEAYYYLNNKHFA